MINPLLDWPDWFVWEYIRNERIEINPLYERGYTRVGCIGCPMAGRQKRLKDFEKYPKYKDAYIRTFDRMLKHRQETGLENREIWHDAESVFRWWMEDKSDPNQITIEQYLEYLDDLNYQENLPTAG